MKYRLILTYLIAGLLLASLTERVWQAVQQVRDAARPAKVMDLDIKNFTLQAKVVVSAMEMVKNPESFSAGSQAARPPSWVQQFADTWLQDDTRGKKTPDESLTVPGVLQRRYILAMHLRLRERAEKLWQVLKSEQQHLPPDERRLLLLLEQGYRQAFQPGRTLAPEEMKFVRSKLGWFGELFAADLAQAGGQQSFIQSRAYAQAERAYHKIMLVTALFGLAGMLGVLAILWFLWFLKKTPPAFFLTAVPGFYFLEIFGLYFCGMFLLEIVGLKAIPSIFPGMSGFDRLLLLNIGGLSALLLILCWPVLFRQPLGSVRQALGWKGAKFARILADAGLGVAGFLAAMPLVALALLANYYLLSALGLDMTKGMHPLVPALVKTKEPVTLALAFLLAAGIAPVVEESMFRGALFAWLRGRLQAWAAILVSAVVFAAVHPQGIFGFLPILVIGSVLALLREWRHGLVPSLVMHACINAGTFLLAVSLFAE